MNKEKYKSVVLDIKTYQLVKDLSEDNDRAITATLKRFIEQGIESDIEECNLDCTLVTGGTPRMFRLLGDLRWYRDNTSGKGTKKYILNKEEQLALLVVIDALADTIE